MTLRHLKFSDVLTVSGDGKTGVSMRDGVIEYLGSEIGQQPADKLFSVYRSPATIANVMSMMIGIPITDGHVDIDLPAPEGIGRVDSAQLVMLNDPSTHTTVAVKNTMSGNLEPVRAMGKTELSLAYHGHLDEHPIYDFEQTITDTHHLGMVEAGRNGPLCRFLDRKPTEGGQMKFKDKFKGKKNLIAAFCDAEGDANIQAVAEIVAALPEAIKAIPLTELAKMLPMLQEIIAMAQGAQPKPAEGDPVPAEGDPVPAADEDKDKDDDKKLADEDPDKDKDEKKLADEDPDKDKDKDKPKFSDAAVVKRAQEFADKAVLLHAEVVDHARTFLDETYSFKGKSTKQVMADALASVTDQKFSDAELPTAFKLLRKTRDYSAFGDSKNAGNLNSLKDKEI